MAALLKVVKMRTGQLVAQRNDKVVRTASTKQKIHIYFNGNNRTLCGVVPLDISNAAFDIDNPHNCALCNREAKRWIEKDTIEYV